MAGVGKRKDSGGDRTLPCHAMPEKEKGSTVLGYGFRLGNGRTNEYYRRVVERNSRNYAAQSTSGNETNCLVVGSKSTHSDTGLGF